MKCPKCGNEVANDSRYCEFCGAEVGYSQSDNDKMCLSIIRVGAEYENILASYNARKKCYRLTKKLGNIKDYKLHVQQLQLDHFPNEFKKSLIGESYIKWLIGCFVGIVLSLAGATCGWYLTIDAGWNWLILAIPTSLALIICINTLLKQKQKKSQKIQEIMSKTVIMI